ncbi:MAG: hypothetical protein M1479_07615 [Actinobacteria bacterium]|nr:hypothetical protein [Actinomycetota bacterium]
MIISDGTYEAMDRNVKFWKRELSDQILLYFYMGNLLRNDGSIYLPGGEVSGRNPNLFDDYTRLLKIFLEDVELEKNTSYNQEILDDDLKIPIAYPELDFGNGMMGAIFGGKVIATSSQRRTYTFNEPVIKEWSQINNLIFDPNNKWVKKITDCLKFFVDKDKENNYLIRLFIIEEGANFVVSMRGTTQAFYDLADNPPELRELYSLGYKVGSEFFEMKREIVKKHNENILDNKEFADLAPIHSVPLLDMDAYALCSPKIFETIGFEYKQKILNHFKGGLFYIHALGSHIVPIAAYLDDLTEIFLHDDPKCTKYFDRRVEMRRQTFNIPLEMFCNYKEFIKALEEKTLPGGVKYIMLVEDPENFSVAYLNDLMKKVKKYRTMALAGKPKK